MQLAERGGECRGELGRDVPDEADRVGEDEGAAPRQRDAPGCRVEGREEPVLDDDAAAGEGVEQRRLAGIGVPHERHDGDRGLAAPALVERPVSPERGYPHAQRGEAVAHTAPVGLELGLPGAAGADAAAETGELQALADEAREQPCQLRDLDLEPSFAGAGALGEDVEDQVRAVEHLGAEGLGEIALLSRGQFVLEQGEVRAPLLEQLGQFGGLAAADERRGVGAVAALMEGADDLGAGRDRQPPELVERLLRGPTRRDRAAAGRRGRPSRAARRDAARSGRPPSS